MLTSNQRRNRRDPARISGYQRNFEREMYKRFAKLLSEIREALIDQDVLGLTTNISLTDRQFAFERDSEKVRGFMRWLNGRIRSGILESRIVEGELVPIGTEPWTNVQIRSSYKKGIERGRQEINNAHRRAGKSTRLSSGPMQIESAFSGPFHADRVAMIYTRTFEDLQNVTNNMATNIRRTLTEGISEGLNPRVTARRLNDRVRKLGITRARTIARTETMRAHHVATVREYEAAEALGVSVRAEWLTAGDDRVCERCADLEGQRFSLKEIEAMLPLHPNCRCVAIPIVEEEE